MSKKTNAILHIRFEEDFLKAVSLAEQPLPAQLGPNDVQIELIAAPIHPSDLGILSGSYGKLPQLPAFPGREGAGRITKIGSKVDPALLGRLVRMPKDKGAWQEIVCAKKDEVFLIPEGVPEEQAAMAFINPVTAWCLLQEISKLPKGSWIIQNAGNSAVGICVIQLAKHFQLNTANVVRNSSFWEPYLKKLGADLVFEEKNNWAEALSQKPKKAPLALGLNSIGGESVQNMLKFLSPGALCVTFGGMEKKPIRFPTRELIFSGIRLEGFWLEAWSQNPKNASKLQEAHACIFRLMQEKNFSFRSIVVLN